MKSRDALLGTLRRPPVEDRDTASETDLDAVINALPVNVLVLDPATANITCANRRNI
jgi:methyl-accepting chemotaxis protein